MANCIQCGRKLPPLTFGKKVCQWCVQHEAAQRGDVDDDVQQRVMPTPWARRESAITLTHVIFGANLAVFIAMVLASGSADFDGRELVHWGANYGPFTLSGAWWRLLSYMFVHGGFFHIAMNMWCLWQMGALCESLYGRWTYAAIYLLTGIAGGLATLAWHPGVPSVGASGALFGLTGALIAAFYLGEFSLSGIHIRGTLTSLLFFAGFSLFFGSVFPGIDNACHVGGLVSGLMLGALIARAAPDANDSLRRGGVLLFVALLVAASAFGIQRWRSYPMRSIIRAQQNVSQMIAELRKRVKEHPQDASAHNALAQELFVLGEYSEGEEELKRVLELEPKNTDARMDLGATYLNQQQPKEAQEQFAAQVAQDPNDAEAHAGLAMALADQQQNKAALEEYKTVLKLAPRMKGVYYQMGVSQLKLKQYDDAIASYLKEREQSGDDTALEMALAEAYDAKGLKPQADLARSRAVALKNGQHD